MRWDDDLSTAPAQSTARKAGVVHGDGEGRGAQDVAHVLRVGGDVYHGAMVHVQRSLATDPFFLVSHFIASFLHAGGDVHVLARARSKEHYVKACSKLVRAARWRKTSQN